MNRKCQIALNWCCCPIVAPLVLLVYACEGLLLHRAGRAAYVEGLKKYLKGEF